MSSMDSGWSWVVLVAAFLIRTMTDGMLFSFGIILSEVVLVYGESVGKAAWVSSILSGTAMLSGPLASALTNRFGFRVVIILGSFLGFVGITSSYFVTSLNVLFVTLGLTTGLGFSMVTVPSSMSINFYFEKRRGLATGINMCASGIGMLVYAPFNVWLINSYGVKGTFLVLGAIYLNCMVLGSVIRPISIRNGKNAQHAVEKGKDHQGYPRSKDGTKLLLPTQKSCDDSDSNSGQSDMSTESKSMFQFHLFKTPSFVLVCISSFIQSFGFYVPYMYLSAHAMHHGLSREASASLVSLIGISMTAGRLIYGCLGDYPKVNLLLLHNCAMTCSGLLTLTLPNYTTYETLVTYSSVIGLAISCTSVTRPLILIQLVGLENVTSAFGFMLLFYGLSGTFGVPLAGFLYDVIGNFDGTFYYGGSVTVLAAVVCYPIGWLHRWETKQQQPADFIHI